ncbi:MAG TPA: hypothetical protein VI248_04180, partial [Kineosporiaceae bacterium]
MLAVFQRPTGAGEEGGKLMVGQFTYPGVYLEEVESPVRPIVGVKTSVAAFVGLALTGPTTPTTVTTWSDFETTFGGLWSGSDLSYAVYQFFLNGGSEAVVVRVGKDPEYSRLALANGPTLVAKQPGAAGAFTATTRKDTTDNPAGDPKAYTLTVTSGSGTAARTETFHGSVDAARATRHLDRLLATSDVVGVSGTVPDTVPDDVHDAASSKVNDVRLSTKDVLGDPAAHTGIYALLDVDIFNLLVIPPQLPPPAGGAADNRDDQWATVVDAAALLCEDRRAVLLLDPPFAWDTLAHAVTGARAALPVTGITGRNAAVFYPAVTVSDPAGGPDRVVGP